MRSEIVMCLFRVFSCPVCPEEVVTKGDTPLESPAHRGYTPLDSPKGEKGIVTMASAAGCEFLRGEVSRHYYEGVKERRSL